jgi:chitinase
MVFSVQSAVESMKEVADIGEEAQEEQRKRTILAFVTAFLLIIPGIGEAADGVAALAMVVRMTRLADAAANAGMSIYGIVTNPDSAPMDIAGMFLGAFAVRNDLIWAKAAAKSRAMSQGMIDSLGASVSKNMGKVKQTCKKCSP